MPVNNNNRAVNGDRLTPSASSDSPFDATGCRHELHGLTRREPLTPALSPSEGERGDNIFGRAYPGWRAARLPWAGIKKPLSGFLGVLTPPSASSDSPSAPSSRPDTAAPPRHHPRPLHPHPHPPSTHPLADS